MMSAQAVPYCLQNIIVWFYRLMCVFSWDGSFVEPIGLCSVQHMSILF